MYLPHNKSALLFTEKHFEPLQPSDSGRCVCINLSSVVLKTLGNHQRASDSPALHPATQTGQDRRSGQTVRTDGQDRRSGRGEDRRSGQTVRTDGQDVGRTDGQDRRSGQTVRTWGGQTVRTLGGQTVRTWGGREGKKLLCSALRF